MFISIKIFKTETKPAQFMKTFIIILISIYFFPNAYGQIGCDPGLNSNVPPSPFTHSYLSFDGKGDFLRSDDLNGLEFPSITTDSFAIEFKMKISEPFKPMNIIGKYRGAGWAIGYHIAEWGYVSLYLNNTWNRIYFLDTDTTWHNYLIKYNKSDLKLISYVDGSLKYEYSGFTYSNMADNSAFSVGNIGFLPQWGPQTYYVSNNWFKGSITSIKITSNTNTIVNYLFNEGAGQVVRDSLTYYYTDRTYPGNSSCGLSHMMLGYMMAADTCDPEWVSNNLPVQSKFTSLGGGVQNLYINGETRYYNVTSSLAMTIWNGLLINTGYFNIAGGVNAKNIASWNGSAWESLGEGLNQEAQSLREFNGELYCGGYFDTAGYMAARYIAKWNGSNWQPVDSGFNSVVNTLYVFNGQLIAGGWFTSAGNTITTYVAKLNSSNEWEAMSTGMSGRVNCFSNYKNELYAGGKFTYASGITANGIAKWDGNKWSPVGAGVFGGESEIFALEVYNGELYAGGNFIKMDNQYCYNIAKFNGTSWSPTGSGAVGALCNISKGYITSLKSFNNELYAAGQFTNINGIDANKLARFNGINWCSVEYGVEMVPRSMEIYDNDLIINGDFYSASGVPCNNIIRYTPVKNITGTGNVNNTPEEFSLKQNYPNPFNPSTKISFIIPNTSFVSLKIFDITGKEIEVLLNELCIEGAYNINFNADKYSSGVYFYRLEAVNSRGINHSECKKMVLIK